MKKLILMFLLLLGANLCWAQTIDELQRKVEAGDAQAQWELGYKYEKGDGVTQNYVKALELYRKSAAQGNAIAQNFLGSCYFNGFGVSKNDTEAAVWFKKAAEQGDMNACHNMGEFYLNGVGVTKDLYKAKVYYEKAVAKGDSLSKERLVEVMLELNNPDLPEICQLNTDGKKLLAEALAGDADAQYHIGGEYEYGHSGFPKDLNKSFNWYKKAAEQGHARAMGNLYICYQKGIGTTKNKSEGKRWLIKSAENGDKSSMYALGINNQLKNKKEAIYWLKKLLDASYAQKDDDGWNYANDAQRELQKLGVAYNSPYAPSPKQEFKIPSIKKTVDKKISSKYDDKVFIFDKGFVIKYTDDKKGFWFLFLAEQCLSPKGKYYLKKEDDNDYYLQEFLKSDHEIVVPKSIDGEFISSDYSIRGSRKTSMTCPKCNGADTRDVTCTSCKGTGVVGDFRFSTRCFRCRGTGKETNIHRCSYCLGDGHFDAEKALTVVKNAEELHGYMIQQQMELNSYLPPVGGDTYAPDPVFPSNGGTQQNPSSTTRRKCNHCVNGKVYQRGSAPTLGLSDPNKQRCSVCGELMTSSTMHTHCKYCGGTGYQR